MTLRCSVRSAYWVLFSVGYPPPTGMVPFIPCDNLIGLELGGSIFPIFDRFEFGTFGVKQAQNCVKWGMCL